MSSGRQTVEFEHIRTDTSNAVGTITMDRPSHFNALDVKMARELRKAALYFARDEKVRCVILAGAEKVFCSGADLKYVHKRGEKEDFSYLHSHGLPEDMGYGSSFKEILEYIHSTISEIRRAPKPFVAAVKGIAAAGGFGIAMSCDLVFASEHARFEWAYPKTGLTGAESATFFLPRLLGLRKAFELVYLNPSLSAQDALSAGLVNRVFAADEFDAEIRRIGEDLAAGPTRALGIAKRLINQAAGMGRLDNHMDRELRNLQEVAEGADFSRGLEAFLGKRKPEFKGR